MISDSPSVKATVSRLAPWASAPSLCASPQLSCQRVRLHLNPSHYSSVLACAAVLSSPAAPQPPASFIL